MSEFARWRTGDRGRQREQLGQRHRGVNQPAKGNGEITRDEGGDVSQENSYSTDKTQFKMSPLHTENNEYICGLQRPSAPAQIAPTQEPQGRRASPGEGGWG